MAKGKFFRIEKANGQEVFINTRNIIHVDWPLSNSKSVLVYMIDTTDKLSFPVENCRGLRDYLDSQA